MVNPNSSDDRGTQRLRDRFREETAQAVLLAAEQVFSEQGFFGASMAQIAERAGVAVGTLYNHFQDRETLLGALLDRRSDELLERLDARTASHGKLAFNEQVRGFVETLFDHFEAHRALLNSSFTGEHVPCQRKTDTPRALFSRVQTLLKVGHRQKHLRADPNQSFPVLLLGAVRSTFMRAKLGAPPLEPGRAADEVTEFFLRGAGR
jgi:AcrR family transcriptional regulator